VLARSDPIHAIVQLILFISTPNGTHIHGYRLATFSNQFRFVVFYSGARMAVNFIYHGRHQASFFKANVEIDKACQK
jgi:hypothetical protein